MGSRAYYAANRERVKESERTYRAANRERINEARRARREANPEQVKESERTYGAANRERIRESDRAYYAANPERMAYYGAKARCTQPSYDGFANYGGRGIRFLFTSFEQFLAEIGPRPGPDHSVDRINVDGNYEPGNVRWATRIEQRHDRRRGRPRTPVDHCDPHDFGD